MLVHTYVYTIICHNIRGSQELQHFATKPKTLTSNVTKFATTKKKSQFYVALDIETFISVILYCHIGLFYDGG